MVHLHELWSFSLAYFGPGAGIALAWSLVMLLVAVLMGLLALLATPLLWLVALWRRARRPKPRGPWRRVVILGFDGLDPRLCERWMESGDLPELAKLRDEGGFTRLGTTFPAISPAAWASFSTGTRPSKHAVFDFIALDRATYLPELSSARVIPPRRRVAVGPWWFNLFSRPDVVQLRRAIPWWVLLGRNGWPSAVLRVPITFPPDRTPFGRQLSGMCLPDLRGSQGTYTLLTTAARDASSADDNEAATVHSAFGAGSASGLNGEFVAVDAVALLAGKPVRVAFPGPPDPSRRDAKRTTATLLLQLTRGDGNRVRAATARERDSSGTAAPERSLVPDTATGGTEPAGSRSLAVAARTEPAPTSARLFARFDGDDGEWLVPGRYSDWMTVRFRTSLGGEFTGCCRLLWLETAAGAGVVSVYATPVMIDPLAPVLPVSHPGVFAPYLAASHGRFATLGLAEDTTALDDGVLSPGQFLDQCWLIHNERVAALRDTLQHTPEGAIVAVFDGSDRIQHMFWNEPPAVPPDEPAVAPATATPADDPGAVDGAINDSPTAASVTTVSPTIRDTYRRFDALVGEVRRQLDPARDLLWVMSDHGFTGFRRQVDLNRWLLDAGYLALLPDADPAGVRWLHGVDWSRTRAFAVGLAGIYLNIAGREREGMVPPADAAALRREIAGRLLELRETGEAGSNPGRVVQRAVPLPEAAPGPFVERGPDLLVGWAHGYRVSWTTVRGGIAPETIADNTRQWSGDHGVDPQLVPGVLFTSAPLQATTPPDGRGPHITDLAPTLLHQFGIQPPPHMDGRPLTFAD